MVARTLATPSARCARVVPHRDAAHSTSSRRRGAVVIRASADDAVGSQATTSASQDDASASSSYGAGNAYVPPAPPRRETPLERAVKDPLAAAIMAPRVALGGLDMLSKGELFAVAAKEAEEVSALLSDPRPIQDKYDAGYTGMFLMDCQALIKLAWPALMPTPYLLRAQREPERVQREMNEAAVRCRKRGRGW